jgi:hypothetical protein
MCHSDDDFSLGVSFFKIVESIRDFTQRITSIDNRLNFSGFKQLFHKNQVILKNIETGARQPSCLLSRAVSENEHSAQPLPSVCITVHHEVVSNVTVSTALS